MVHSNEFNNNITGIGYLGENNECTFLTNCFDQPDIDVVVADCIVIDDDGNPTITPGIVKSAQGSNEIEAGNCFSLFGLREIINLGPTINYFIETNWPPSTCPRTPDSWGVDEMDASNVNSPDNCGSNLPPEVVDCTIQLSSPAEIIVAIEEVDGYLTTNTSDTQERTALGLRQKLFSDLARFALGIEDGAYLTNILNFLRNRTEFSAKILVPAYYSRVGSYALARAEIESITPSTQGESDYLYSQGLYLNYLESGPESITPLQLNDLKIKAQNADPINSFARSIYYIVSRERIIIPMPELDMYLEQRSRESESHKYTIECYPNPIEEDNLIIYLHGVPNGSVEINIMNTNGTHMKRDYINAGHDLRISTMELDPGCYFILARDTSGRIIANSKFIKLNN